MAFRAGIALLALVGLLALVSDARAGRTANVAALQVGLQARGLYGGTIDFTAILGRGSAPQPGVFFRIDPAGDVRVIREGVVASNGIAFSPTDAMPLTRRAKTLMGLDALISVGAVLLVAARAVNVLGA